MYIDYRKHILSQERVHSLVVQIVTHGIRTYVMRMQCIYNLLVAQHATVRLLGGLDLADQQLGEP